MFLQEKSRDSFQDFNGKFCSKSELCFRFRDDCNIAMFQWIEYKVSIELEDWSYSLIGSGRLPSSLTNKIASLAGAVNDELLSWDDCYGEDVNRKFIQLIWNRGCPMVIDS